MKSVVVITGGANGLGRELVAMFHRKHKIIILDIDGHALSRVAKKFSTDSYVCDISNWIAVESVIEDIEKKYQKIDYLINCAGIYLQGQLTTNDPKKIKQVFEVNTLGTINLCRFVTPLMKKQKQGTIVNIISQAALYPCESRSVYHASKWAIDGFTKSLQPELAPYGIKVIGIYPGLMDTKFLDKSGFKRNMDTALKPEEVVKLIAFIFDLPPHLTISEIGIKHLSHY
jgi:NADP-dependent 3-hydroxy acid dehydrogenase YdfG